MKKQASIIPSERIEQRIFLFRGHRVMLDSDLAKLYGVPTRRLNEQVKRNRERFPEDFMFQLTKQEAETWQHSRSQFAILKQGSNIKYLPYVFTEFGAIMAANVLNSPRAVMMSVEVVRAFVRLRQMTLSVEELNRKVNALEKGFQQHGKHFEEQHGKHFEAVFDAIRKLMEPPPEPPRRRIGFHTTDD